MNVLISGKTSFKVEVPYRLIETGTPGDKPLIVYLHGFGQNLDKFQRQMKKLLEVRAYHLFIQGPYVNIGDAEYRGKWGYSWYIYNGKQGSFIKSLEYTSEFVQEVIDGLVPHLKIDRVCVLGYSMGAYLAGYFAFSRYKHTNDLILIGGRFKSEAFRGRIKKGKHIRVLSVHGKKDTVVNHAAQQEHIQVLVKAGIDVTAMSHPGGHELAPAIVNRVYTWMRSVGYNSANIKK
ncbi:MAG: alpha/beta hydrolase [Cyclonatronaceae bacterium]